MVGGGMLMLTFWIAPFALIAWGLGAFRRRRETERDDTALEILRRRYASGEIGREEFEQARGPLT